MASWFATFMVAVLMLLVSSAAQAHVAHDGEVASIPSEVRAISIDPADDVRTLGAERIAAGDPDDRIFTDEDHGGSDQTSGTAACCATGLSGCASILLPHPAPTLRRPVAIITESPSGTPSLEGTTVDGLIRPPRASV